MVISQLLFPGLTTAQTIDSVGVKKLKKLSLEELMNVSVTSISMRPEKLTEVASAVQVLTDEDITPVGSTSCQKPCA